MGTKFEWGGIYKNARYPGRYRLSCIGRDFLLISMGVFPCRLPGWRYGPMSESAIAKLLVVDGWELIMGSEDYVAMVDEDLFNLGGQLNGTDDAGREQPILAGAF